MSENTTQGELDWALADKLNYPGDCIQYDEYLLYGPDAFGAYYKAVGARYDAEKNQTTIALKPVPPAKLAAFAERLAAEGKPIWEGYYGRPQSGS
ncbi:hypothetical protein SEA_LEOPARD_93 [Mycobacterium phage Leopard]|uniref:Uncharacterized protein n=1 Tax=Mycobacterium phage Onyinye TaxID=2686235 RepID=A0A6B9L6Y6_9CAUD|nr:hypothetical protein PP339_gp093 [Mycobacterium phage Onyinye]QHB37497.1 hypothetical protein SEA_ONYINYE_93 [Mycobacterium phage Onyinye]UOW92969.1 hypothetical protein SEA_LEOPARD_93 [Mycobacterium phage Leopard]WKW85256.1 hypothetical protein SEA_AIKOY__94 [Mycobacterium phage Aikoy]